jgi:hypothetical protein
MTGTLAKFTSFYHLINTLHVVMEPSFLSLFPPTLFILKACLLFLIKKGEGGLKGCRGLLFYNFQISYVCLTDVSVSDAFIQLPLYN